MFSNYSKLIGAIVGNIVAIALVYAASHWPFVASCTVLPDGNSDCTIFGFAQADITITVMAVLNAVFVYFFPPNRATIKAIAMVGFFSLTVVALASCTLSAKQETELAKVYDRTCAAEPSLYLSFMTVAEAKQASAKTLAKAEAIHTTMVGLCTNRPTDIVTAAATLSAAYANFVAIMATVERS